MTLIERAARLEVRVLRRLHGDGNWEHEMLNNRPGIATTVGVYFRLAFPGEQAESLRLRALCLGYCVGALLLVAHPLLKPGASEMRCPVCEPALNQSGMSKAHCL